MANQNYWVCPTCGHVQDTPPAGVGDVFMAAQKGLCMEGVIDYPFQLRPELFVHLRLPGNLTREEVQRLGGFLNLLVTAEASDVDGGQIEPSGAAEPSKP